MEQIAKVSTFPQKCFVTNIDICPEVIESMNANKKEMAKFGEIFEYVTMDACNMTFKDESFDLCLDKGTVDALLCHLDDEIGETDSIKKLVAEVFRILKPNGKYLLISGNSNFILYEFLTS
jgi:ubiquinone/menaquinone biosynthesis C-methylase UbiE